MLKKFIIFATLVATLFTVGCGDGQEKEFIEAVRDGIIVKYENFDSDKFITEPMYTIDDYEYVKMKEFEGVQFKDEEFDGAAKDYIESVMKGKELQDKLESRVEDKDEQIDRLVSNDRIWEQRYESFKYLSDRYNLDLSKEMEDSIGEWMNYKEKRVSVNRQIRKEIDDARIKKDEYRIDIDVVNTTDMEVMTAYLKVAILDSNGYVIKEDVCERYGWMPGEEVTFTYSIFRLDDVDKVEIEGFFGSFMEVN